MSENEGRIPLPDGEITYKLNRNSSAWAAVFRNSPEIRDGLNKFGHKLTVQHHASNYQMKTLRYTQVAVVYDPK